MQNTSRSFDFSRTISDSISRFQGWLLIAWIFSNSLLAHAASITMVASRDNSMYSDNPANSNGGGALFIGRNGGGGTRRTLLRFDVASVIPTGSHIDSVELHLNVSRVSFGQPLPASLHRVSADWGEAASNAGLRSGAGAAALIGDSTWTHRFFSTIPWATPGGDFLPNPSATNLIGSGANTLASTAGLVADVQSWLNFPSSNFGWILRGDESEAGTARRIDSRELASPALRPMIVVQYSETTSTSSDVPIPPWVAMLTAPLILLVVLKSQRLIRNPVGPDRS